MAQAQRPHESRTRVVVTGMGAITAAGPDVAALRVALHGEHTCIGDVTLFETDGLRTHIAGEVRTMRASRLLPRVARARASRSDRFALLATEEALAHGGLELPFADPARIGVAIGSSTGGMLETESYYRARLAQERPRGLRKRLAAATVAAPTDLVAAALGTRGPRLSPSTACSSGAIALAMAASWIRAGRVDVAIAGGSDALARMTYTGFHALQALSSEPCRPFDRERRGLSLGEGAGIVILESEAHARARGARILAELAGSGLSCDASHPTAPHGEARGAVLALEAALRDAGASPSDIDYVNAHGTGTVQNDASETFALRRVLGAAAGRVAVSSTKALIGHLLGAAGAVEAIVTVLAIEDGWAPPTLHLRHADPACDLDYVPNVGRRLAIAGALSNSYGFGGNNCSLVLRRA